MFKFEYLISKKLIYFPLLVILSTLCLGLFNSDWFSLIFYQLLFLLLYSSKITKNKKNWLFSLVLALICIIVKIGLYVPKISMGANVFIGGEAYKESIFSKKLPNKIFKKLDNDFQIAFPNSISGPDKNLYDISVNQILGKVEATKLVETVNWKNRYQLALGAFNDTRYNTYGLQEPPRNNLPFFVKYIFPEEYNSTNAKFCWEGLAFIGSKLEEKKFDDFQCMPIKDFKKNKNESSVIWLVETGLSPKLKAKLLLPTKYKLIILFKKIVIIIFGFILLALLFKKLNLSKAIFFSLSSIITFFFSLYFYPDLIHKFILFEGGNDGLNYVHFAHIISDHIVNKQYLLAFMGGEKAYDLMPFYRYIWIVNYFFFEESPWMLFFILTFFPIVIYEIFNDLLDKQWAKYFLIFWFFIPLFEAFGFLHFYYVKLAIRGFGEPISYLCFLSALMLVIKFYKEIKISNSSSFLIGLLFSLAIGTRANIFPACGIIIIFFIFQSFNKNDFIKILFLFLGLSFTFIMPIHNYVFTQKFIPFTIAAYTDWNLGARPSDYLNFFIYLLKFEFNNDLWSKIISHIGGEIKIYEFWYHLSIISCIYYGLSKKAPIIIKCISLSALSLVVLLFFYHVGGRYSYLTWTLTLIILLYGIKNFFFQSYIKVKEKDAT